MARLSGWQNFAKNFKSTKEVFDDMFTAIETKKIMDEEVETIHHGDAGLSPHAAAPTQWKYGGKTYDKQITPGELTGLRQARIADVMTRFGDHEGAMDYLTKQATLTNIGLDTEVKKGTLSEQIRAVKLKNDALVATMNLTKAQTERYNKLTPLEAEKYLAQIAEQKRSTAESRALMPGKLDKQKAEVGLAESEASIAAQKADEFTSNLAKDNRERGLKITEAEQINQQKRLELEKDKLTSTYDNELATFLAESNTNLSEAQATEMASKLSLQGNETLTEFATKMANREFKSAAEQKKWLLDAWDDTHDPRIKDMISGIDEMQLSQITAEGTKTMAEINNALSGKSSNAAKAALIKVIDKQDGIEGNMKFGKDGKGNTVLYEYPSAEAMKADKDGTGTGGEAVITGHGAGWTKFTESLYAEFTPLKSLEIAKTNADIRYVNAQAKFKEAEAGMKVTLAEAKAWGDHTQTDLFKQLATKSAEDFKNTTGFDTMDEYAKDYISRMRTATGVTSFEGFSSPDFP